jgi:hypothetical protein
MLQGERRFGVFLAAVVVIALIAGPAPASAAKNCPGKVERHAYTVTAAGHNGGSTTLDGQFTSGTRVEFSFAHKAVLRVCEAIAEVRMNSGGSVDGAATHQGQFVRDLDTGELCAWEEGLPIGGPLKARGYDFARADGSSVSDWAFVVNYGIGYDKEVRDAYAESLRAAHVGACGEDVPMVATLGPDSQVFGALTAHRPDFVWPGFTIEGRGRRNSPPILRKLLAGRDTKVAGQVDYPNEPAGSFVEHGTWLVSLKFERRGR